MSSLRRAPWPYRRHPSRHRSACVRGHRRSERTRDCKLRRRTMPSRRQPASRPQPSALSRFRGQLHWRGRSDAHEWLEHAADPALKLDVALQRDEADALDRRPRRPGDARSSSSASSKSPGAVAAVLVPERALEHARPFRAGVPCCGSTVPGAAFSMKTRAALFARHIHRAPMDAAADPPPRPHAILTKAVPADRRDGFARRLHAGAAEHLEIRSRQRALQCIGRSSAAGSASSSMRAADMLECAQRPAACRADRQMRRHHDAAAFVRASRRQRRPACHRLDDA